MGVETLLAVGGGLAAAGALTSGISGFQAGQANAKAAAQEADLAQQTGQMESDRTRQAGRRLVAQQKVAAAASGLDVAEGTPLQIMLDTVRRNEEDAMLSRWRGDVRATGFRNEATLQKRQGRQSLISGALGAGTAIASSLGTIGAYRAKLDANALAFGMPGGYR